MKNLIYLFLLSMSITFYACGGSSIDDCNSAGYTAEFQSEFDAITSAASAYGNDPSASNCDKLKDAYNDYIDALEKWEDCANHLNQYTEWKAAVDNFRAAVQTIC